MVVKLRLSTRLRLILSLPVWLLRILPQRRRGCARPRGGWANLVGRPSSAARGRPLLPRFWPVSPHFFPVLKLMDPLPPIRAAAQPCAFSVLRYPCSLMKALLWFWIIDKTLVLTSILSVYRLNEVGTYQVMEQVMIMVMMVMTTR